MKKRVVDSTVPYLVRLAIALKVHHEEPFIYKTAQGIRTYSFAYTLCDRMEYRFPQLGLTLSAKAGQTVFIPKELPHSTVYLTKDSSIIVYQFDIEGVLPTALQKPFVMPEEAAVHFRDFSDEYAPPDCLRCTARIYDLLSLLLRSDDPLPRKYRVLLPALEEIEKHPSERRSVEHYAGLCNLSESAFRRAFKSYTGQSPIEYRNSLRLANARNLLLYSDYSVEEVSRRCGFTNLSFFYRLYRRTYGKKPGEI